MSSAALSKLLQGAAILFFLGAVVSFLTPISRVQVGDPVPEEYASLFDTEGSYEVVGMGILEVTIIDGTPFFCQTTRREWLGTVRFWLTAGAIISILLLAFKMKRAP